MRRSRHRYQRLAIGISVSHRIFDGSSLETFVQSWAEHSSGAAVAAVIPSFDSPSLFPRGELDCTSSTDKSEIWNITICAKRFLFTNEAIARLRSELMAEGGGGGAGEISRVRAVSAAIAKALIGVDRARHGRWRPYLIVQAFNMRKRTVPPLAKHSCGNLAVQSITRTMSAVESESASVGGLAGVLGEAIDKTTSDCSRILRAGAEGLKEIVVEAAADAFVKPRSDEVNVIWFSDWSKFGFHETDLGWGKPVWASIGPVAGENMAILTEREDGGGIEAWVHLNSNDMAYFEKEEVVTLFTKLM